MGQVHESWRVYASFIYKPLKKGSTNQPEKVKPKLKGKRGHGSQEHDGDAKVEDDQEELGLLAVALEVSSGRLAIKSTPLMIDWVPGLIFKAEVQIWRKTERTGTSCCESFFLVAKLDVDKDEGEDGKEEHHVSHLSEQYSLNMEIYANYFPPKSNIIFWLEKRPWWDWV